MNKNDRRGGFYWKDGKPYVSVTKVLEVIDKPALRYWIGKEIYYALVKEPNLTLEEALSKPFVKNVNAKERGSVIHSLLEAYKHTKSYIKNIPSDYKGYAQAFYNFVEDNDLKILRHEKTVLSKIHKFAGTLDLLVENRQAGKIFIIDVKTGKNIYPEASLQLSAYRNALEEEGQKIDAMGVLLLQENGIYKFANSDYCFDAFLACKTLWCWKNREICEKVGYKND